MRRLYENLKKMLRGFIDQRDDFMLLVASGDSNCADLAVLAGVRPRVRW